MPNPVEYMASLYRAICPACSKRLSRRHCIFPPRYDRCEHCRVGIRTHKRRFNGLIVQIVLAGIFLPSVFEVVSWWYPVTFLALFVPFAWITFPLLSSYDRVTEGPQCLHCGYDLNGMPSPICPECGRPDGDSQASS